MTRPAIPTALYQIEVLVDGKRPQRVGPALPTPDPLEQLVKAIKKGLEVGTERHWQDPRICKFYPTAGVRHG